MPKGKSYQWTPAMHRFCDKRRYMIRRELAIAFNQEFGEDRSCGAVRGFCKRNGYTTGRTGKFEKGRVSHNKGRKGWSAKGTEATRFKVGNRPVSAVPVGTRNKSAIRYKQSGTVKDPGYWRTKIAEPNVWRFDHILLCEKHNGPVAKGHCVIFVDGDQDNLSIENLTLLTRAELVVLNKLISEYTDLDAAERATMIAMAKLRAAATARLFTPEDKAIAERHGISQSTAYARIQKGWPKQRAITAPVGSKRAA